LCGWGGEGRTKTDSRKGPEALTPAYKNEKVEGGRQNYGGTERSHKLRGGKKEEQFHEEKPTERAVIKRGATTESLLKPSDFKTVKFYRVHFLKLERKEGVERMNRLGGSSVQFSVSRRLKGDDDREGDGRPLLSCAIKKLV